MHTQGVLTNLGCESGGLSLQFDGRSQWESAQSAWDVGVQSSRDEPDEFVVIVGHNQCQSPSAPAVEVSLASYFCLARAECSSSVLSYYSRDKKPCLL